MSKILTTEMLNELSNRFGDAFYLLDSDVFKHNYENLLASFRKYYSNFNIAYSYKTNYTPKLVKIVDQLGGYAEVVSEMELEIALRSGVKPEKIIWNGPIKSEEKVKELLLAGGTVNVDSIYEIKHIKSIAENYPEHVLNLGIRINYDVGDGVISRFGFDVEDEHESSSDSSEGNKDFHTILQFVINTPNVKLLDLQAHFAKRNPEYWTARAEGMLKIYDKIVRKYGLKPERLDIGGGIYGSMPESLRMQLGIGNVTYDDYASKAAKIFSEHFRSTSDDSLKTLNCHDDSTSLNDIKCYDTLSEHDANTARDDVDVPCLLIEPGSALAGDCMRFVCKVKTIKTVRGKAIATVIGSQKNISMNGINPPMKVIAGGREKQKSYKDLDIVGFTCIEGDVLQKGYSGLLAVGDYIVIENCGSYSLVMKPPFILPNFPVLDISGSEVEIIKRAETCDDLFRTFSF